MIWKEKQKEELLKIGIVQTDEQFVFTYKTRKTNKLNVPVHIDYLNHRINAVEKRHPYLVHATPHMFRHTFSTLAYEGGATMEQISQMLTHSDTNITKIYVNTESVVDLSTHEKFEKRLLMENSSLEFVPKQEKNTL
ncbi:tyrosine-type recombinase/integrase [Enterococcus sp. DIV2463a]